MTYSPIECRSFENDKEAREVFDRALKIAEHIRGDILMPGEYAALYFGMFRSQDNSQRVCNWATEWELIAEAARAAMDGKGVVDGELVPVRKSLRQRILSGTMSE